MRNRIRVNATHKLERDVEEEDDRICGMPGLFDEVKKAIPYYIIIGTAIIGALYICSRFSKDNEKPIPERNISTDVNYHK